MNTHPHRRTRRVLALFAAVAALGAGLAGCDRGADETPALPPAGDRTVPPTPPEVPPPTGTGGTAPATTDPLPSAADPAASPASQ